MQRLLRKRSSFIFNCVLAGVFITQPPIIRPAVTLESLCLSALTLPALVSGSAAGAQEWVREAVFKHHQMSRKNESQCFMLVSFIQFFKGWYDGVMVKDLGC